MLLKSYTLQTKEWLNLKINKSIKIFKKRVVYQPFFFVPYWLVVIGFTPYSVRLLVNGYLLMVNGY
jgi:hypothetical protein